MSHDDAVSRKEKKAQRDADRRRKGKKRKHQEVEEDALVEEPDELQKDFIPLDVQVDENEVKSSAKSLPKSKSKKRKANDIEDSTKPDPTPETKSKKRKKSESSGETHDGVTPKKADTSSQDKKHKFILFVGNLPYTATDAAIKAHFKSLQPFNLRHRTDPKTGKSKGFAFIEFEGYDRMKTCLKLYHHSMFDPDKTIADDEAETQQGGEEKPVGKKARRLNVELTAGGGGKAEGRKEKIRVKNQRLGEQRQRRAEAERKEREKKAKEGREVNTVKSNKKNGKDTGGRSEEEGGMEGVHPSRLARIAA